MTLLMLQLATDCKIVYLARCNNIATTDTNPQNKTICQKECGCQLECWQR